MIPTPQRRDMFQGKRRVFENNFKFRNANREMIPTPQRRDMFQGKRRVFENNVKMMETHEHIYKSIDVIKAIKEEKDDVSIR